MNRDLKEKLGTLRIDRDEAAAPRRRGTTLAVVAVAVIVAALAVAWGLRERPVAVKTAAVAAAASSGDRRAAVLNASGYVTARRQATVSSKITGKVEEVFVEEGLEVSEGQVLARLDDRQARLALALAEAERDAAAKGVVESEALSREARLRLGRVRELAREGVAATADLDAVEAEVDSLVARIEALRATARAADRAVALARQALDDTVIRAPFDGVAVSKNAQPGEMISPVSAGGGFTRTGISTIVDMTSLEIEVDVNEAYIQRVSSGQRVSARLDAYPEWEIPARVITTIPTADRQKATVTVRIGFDALDPRLLPDMGVKVAFLSEEPTGDAPARATTIPRPALRGAAGSEFVLVVGPDGRLERRAVRVGAGGSTGAAEILAGLAVGERVVVEGPADLAAGARVEER